MLKLKLLLHALAAYIGLGCDCGFPEDKPPWPQG